ncbi:flagellar assembly protein FliH [Aeromonas diversa CDC 2478-85]|uniref:Flagellar assembly protein FliH n=1 Tax=Aeromonas diversa CDC 2478-85 TaxID=1268237 RepID=N9V7L5_9GAMM|nr:flagellar assembly protein FliH [Aeromonas diversa]ENY71232.1 flagellar assembly protein FliH [Aeromonas diversa CDC 2478-85]
MSDRKLRGYLRPEQDSVEVQDWGWPEMEVEQSIERNALGLAPDWYQQAVPQPEVEPEPEPAPTLTAEELEAIRQAAWEEGMSEGREAGFAQGLEEGKLEGLQKGHEAGFSQGREEGLAMGREVVEQAIAHWQQLATRLATPLGEMDEQVEEQLVSLAMQLARALIKHEVETSPRLLLAALKEGLAQLPVAEEGVTMMLHPDDVERIQSAFGAEECAKRGWRLEADPTLEPGDLQLATRLSSIDMQLEARINQLLRNFLRDNQES